MERCNARTMEIYRRMGLADRIRGGGPAGATVRWTSSSMLSLVEPPLVHHPHPSVAEAKARIAKCHDGTLPLEPYQLISQYTLEPLLKSVAETLPSDRGALRPRIPVVRAGRRRRHRDGAGPRTARPRRSAAQYLVGCDGGASTVRKQLGITLAGEGNLLQLCQALYRCDELYERIPIGKGRHYHVADDRATQLIVQDSTRHFTLHSIVDRRRPT